MSADVLYRPPLADLPTPTRPRPLERLADQQYRQSDRWRTIGESVYRVIRSTRGDTLGRGTFRTLPPS